MRGGTVLRMFVAATDLQCEEGPGQLLDVSFSSSAGAADAASGASSDGAQVARQRNIPTAQCTRKSVDAGALREP